MDCEHLIECLRKEAGEKIRVIGEEAKAAAAKIGEETALKICRLREEYERTTNAAAAKRIGEIQADADTKARLLRAAAAEGSPSVYTANSVHPYRSCEMKDTRMLSSAWQQNFPHFYGSR